MQYQILFILSLSLCGCSTSEFDSILKDLNRSKLTEFFYKVDGFNTFKCDVFNGQKILKTWGATLKIADIASWPSPDNYLVLTFDNGNKYNVKTFIGSTSLKYSVLYTNTVHTGEQLKIERICTKLKNT